MKEPNTQFREMMAVVVGVVLLLSIVYYFDDSGMESVSGFTVGCSDSNCYFYDPRTGFSKYGFDSMEKAQKYASTYASTYDAEKTPSSSSYFDDYGIINHLDRGSRFGSGFWLLFDEDTRQGWLDGAMGKLAQSLNMRYWLSEICLGKYNVETGTGGGVMMGSVGGLPMMAVSVKGEKMDFSHPNETDTSKAVHEYFYKIEYWVSYPEGSLMSVNDEIQFDIFVKGSQTAQVNRERITVPKGSVYSGTGTKMITKYSQNNYDRVCLKFTTDIRDYDGNKRREFCDTFSYYTGGATPYQPQTGGSGNYDPNW